MVGIFTENKVEEEPKLYDEFYDKIKLNSEYEKMIPLASVDEREEIKKSLLKHGQKYPVIVDSKTMDLVDGYSRYRLLVDLKLKIWYKLKQFESKGEILHFVLISNVHRRHLRPFDKIRLFRPLYETEKALAKKRLKEIGRHKGKGGRALTKFSERIGVSPDTTERSLRILDKGTAEQIKMVRNRVVSVTSMDRIITHKQKITMEDKAHRYFITIKNAKGKTVQKYTRNLTDRNYDHLINYIRTI